jgi:hypothetical protein
VRRKRDFLSRAGIDVAALEMIEAKRAHFAGVDARPGVAGDVVMLVRAEGSDVGGDERRRGDVGNGCGRGGAIEHDCAGNGFADVVGGGSNDCADSGEDVVGSNGWQAGYAGQRERAFDGVESAAQGGEVSLVACDRARVPFVLNLDNGFVGDVVSERGERFGVVGEREDARLARFNFTQ